MTEFYMSYPCSIQVDGQTFNSSLEYYASLLGVDTVSASVTVNTELIYKAERAKYEQNPDLLEKLLSVSEEDLASSALKVLYKELQHTKSLSCVICRELGLIKTPVKDYPEDLYRVFCSEIQMDPKEFVSIPPGSSKIDYDKYSMTEADAVRAIEDIYSYYNCDDFDDMEMAEYDKNIIIKNFLRDVGYIQLLERLKG